MNENGDREADYTLSDLDPETGVMTPVATYYGAKRLYEKHAGVAIAWPGGKTTPPLDVPRCGFRGEAVACREPEPFPLAFTLVIVIFVVFIIGSLIAFLVYRKIVMESALADCWWKIKWDEIIFSEKGASGKRSQASLKSENSLGVSQSAVGSIANTQRSGSQASSMNTTCANVHGVRVGTYRGVRVAVKMLEIPKIHVNRWLLMELKMVSCKEISKLLN